MLKKIYLKKKQIPVPIPITNLEQAVHWIEATFLENEKVITKINLNGANLIDSGKNFSSITLDNDSILEIEVDSPRDLAVYSLESMIGFLRGIHNDAKELAVQCWQLNRNEKCEKFDLMLNDLFLVKELSDHSISLLNLNSVDSAPVQALTGLMIRVTNALKIARQKQDWKECSSILLNRLEYILKDFANECEELQMHIIANKISINEKLKQI